MGFIKEQGVLVVREHSRIMPSSVKVTTASTCSKDRSGNPLFSSSHWYSSTITAYQSTSRGREWSASLNASSLETNCVRGAFMTFEYVGPGMGLDPFEISSPVVSSA